MPSEVLGGAAEGAATGFSVAGPIGGVIGGVLGGIGGIFKDKAKARKRRAARARAEITKIQNFQARRAFVNNFLTAQSNALAEGSLTGADLGSSGVQGQLASIRTQATTGLVEQSEQGRLSELSGALEAQANKFAGLGAISDSLISAGASIAGEFGTPKPKVSTNPGINSNADGP